MAKGISGREWLVAILVLLSLAGGVVVFVPLRAERPNEAAGRTTAFSGQPGEGGDSVTATSSRLTRDVFADLRLERERGRSRQEEMFSKILDDPATQSELRTAAQQELWRLTHRTALEGELEGLLRAKGYAQVVVMLRDAEATVLVQAAKLSPGEVAEIAELVSRLSGVPRESIQVHEKA